MPKIITDVSWSATGLPTGVSIDKNTGTLTGTPSEAGEYTVPVTVETNYGRNSKNVSVNVKNPYWVKRLLPKFGGTQTTAYSNGKLFYTDSMSYSESGAAVLMSISKTGGNSVCVMRDITFERIGFNSSGGYTFSSTSVINDICQQSGAVFYILLDGVNNIFQHPWLNSDKIWNAKVSNSWYAASYSPELDYTCIVTSSGELMRRSRTSFIDSTPIEVGMKVNKGCLRWSDDKEIFCLCGSNGVAISPDGETWTKSTANVPKDLVELEWHKDISKFVARSTGGKVMYGSADGLSWEKLHEAAIPLENIRKVAYSKELKKYCAISGSKSKYAYFSTDLENWEVSQIAENELLARDIIYAPAFSNWILTCSSGDSYYTLEE